MNYFRNRWFIYANCCNFYLICVYSTRFVTNMIIKYLNDWFICWLLYTYVQCQWFHADSEPNMDGVWMTKQFSFLGGFCFVLYVVECLFLLEIVVNVHHVHSYNIDTHKTENHVLQNKWQHALLFIFILYPWFIVDNKNRTQFWKIFINNQNWNWRDN